jgi:hypothetical protein
MDRISLSAWLQITGPTFATMVLGIALLWNGQQALAAQQLELGRSMGRLEGSIAGVDRSIAALGERIDRLGSSIERLADRVSALESR